MKYALNLSEDYRILSSCVVLPKGSYDTMPIVEELPDGDITEYRYMDGQYIHDPFPEPEPEPSTPTLEDRVGTLEETLEMILSGVTE